MVLPTITRSTTLDKVSNPSVDIASYPCIGISCIWLSTFYGSSFNDPYEDATISSSTSSSFSKPNKSSQTMIHHAI